MTDQQIRTTASGYALHVECQRGHSGNQGYVLSQRGYWACQGCGDFATTESMVTRQARGYREAGLFPPLGAAAALAAAAEQAHQPLAQQLRATLTTEGVRRAMDALHRLRQIEADLLNEEASHGR